jgi:neogenin
VFYTTDHTKDDLDWVVEGVLGEKLSMTITDLTADTTYYFKVQARNSKGYGPMSPTKIYKTPKSEYIFFFFYMSVFAKNIAVLFFL